MKISPEYEFPISLLRQPRNPSATASRPAFNAAIDSQIKETASQQVERSFNYTYTIPKFDSQVATFAAEQQKTLRRQNIIMDIADIDAGLRDGVATIRIARPAKRNSLARPHLDRLRELLAGYAEDPAVRCLVLTGTGKAFCAGADVDEWAQAQERGELETYGWTDKAHDLVQTLTSFPVPTVAALNGSAVGAGADLSFACDFRIASASASLRCGYTSMAYSPDMGGTWFLPRIARPDVVKRFLFLNERWSAQDAYAAGLVSEVVGDEAFIGHVEQFTQKLAHGPSVAFAHTKTLLARSLSNSLAEQLRCELVAGVACGRSEDGEEALRASVHGRTPHFLGR